MAAAPLTSPQRQLLLDLELDQPRTFDNFVAGANGELLARLADLAPGSTALYLWGPEGSGRSHLLQAATARAAGQRAAPLLRGDAVGDYLTPPPGALLAVDDVERLDAAAQIALFRAFNSARLEGWTLLLSGPCPPAQLNLREDLRTRIGQCLIYEVQALSEEDKAATLRQQAAARGMRLDEAIVQWLLRHGRRDLPSLLAALDALDRASLEQKRPPTLPLLRAALQSRSDLA
ncbi:DnaA regulatory inactivator Hda [Denitratisoma sp. DHT3]|uniref:DnaA regulatory inactivator Hda n=1 Tax=Denitratisoma sp. DHT3 TaxID=1981880 RepID=UPI00119889E4|nr:DnaA regulatory inactivator Hda [Denitratisoma sp. DHT3]QDX83032.1 DnaA regulatory inactivator Hda [Denitratisoma sp. DHT3]